MIIEEVLTNISELEQEELAKRHQEKVYLESAHLVKRIQRVKTDSGRDLGIRLKNTQSLEIGDILYMDEEKIIVVDVLPDDLLIIQPKNMYEMGMIAHQLGNRHLPAQFENDEMLVQYDYLVEKLLKELNISFIREDRKVSEAFQHTGHHHD